jgi:hypothetical protein
MLHVSLLATKIQIALQKLAYGNLAHSTLELSNHFSKLMWLYESMVLSTIYIDDYLAMFETIITT